MESAPDERAFAFPKTDEKIHWENWDTSYEHAARIACILKENGLGKGDCCVLVLNSDEFATKALLATFFVGAVPVLIAPPVVRGLHSNLVDVIRHVVDKTSAKMLLIGDEWEQVGTHLQQEFAGLEKLLSGEALTAPDVDIASFSVSTQGTGDVAAYQLTSGTTGLPRICVWKHQHILAALDGMQQAMDLCADDVFVNWTPLYHDMGLVNNFLLCLLKNIPLVMLETMDFMKRPALWLRTLNSAKATTTWSPNFGFTVAAQRIRDSQIEGVNLDHVRGFWNAAERIHLKSLRTFHRRFEPYGVKWSSMKANFGCAENVGGATFTDPHGKLVYELLDRKSLFENGLAKTVSSEADGISVVSVGRPHPGIDVEIRGEDGVFVSDGHVGEIALRTPSRMEGFLKDTEQTNQTIIGDYLYTGDLGYKRGDEIFWAGRSRERINLHGKKYDPSDFENILFTVEELRKGCFAAFGIDDEAIGTERLVIVAEVRIGAPQSNDQIMQTIIERVMTDIGVTVNEVVLVPQGTMTKTSSGKRRHQYYKKLYLNQELPAASE